MTTIYKEFNFAYGHRVWNQTEPPCRCRSLHGHTGTLRVTLTRDELINGMCIDFTRLRGLRTQLEQNFDHKFYIHVDDPLLSIWLHSFGLSLDSLLRNIDHYIVREVKDSVTQEFFGSLVIMDFVPTSENLVLFFKRRVNTWLLGTDVTCVECTWMESDTSGATA